MYTNKAQISYGMIGFGRCIREIQHDQFKQTTTKNANL